MKAFLILAFVAACSAQRFIQDGRYVQQNDGRYVHDANAGKYVHVANPYVHDGRDSGKYVHVDNPYVHDGRSSGQYVHDARPYVHDAGRYVQQRVIVPQAVQAAPVYTPKVRYQSEGGWAILKHISDILPEGHYSYEYETENKIHAAEQSRHEPIDQNSANEKRQGFFEYIGDDGQKYRVDYTADENGFIPSAAHLPTPPPIPAEIARSLQLQQQRA